MCKLTTRDKNTKLSFNSDGVRQIEKDNLILILILIFEHSISDVSIVTIVDSSGTNNRHNYEMTIPSKESLYVCEVFDTEMDRRMRESYNRVLKMIESDLELSIEETNFKKNLNK